MENVVLSWGFQVTGLECLFPCVCVGPACHQQSAVKEPAFVLHVCYVSLPKHSCPTERRERWNPVWTRRSVNPLSPAERGGRRRGTTTCRGTDIANHTCRQLRSLEGVTFASLSLYDTVRLVTLDALTGQHDSSQKEQSDLFQN